MQAISSHADGNFTSNCVKYVQHKTEMKKSLDGLSLQSPDCVSSEVFWSYSGFLKFAKQS